MTTAAKNIVALGMYDSKNKEISYVHHDDHRFRNVILKGIKSLILSWQKTLAKRTLVRCSLDLKNHGPNFL